MSEEGKDSHHHHHGHHHHHHHHEDDQPPPPPPPPAEYGTFQAPPQPVVGFPQPVPPPGAFEPSPEYYARAYQVVPGYVVDERGPVREPRLPCCGIGLGWFLMWGKLETKSMQYPLMRKLCLKIKKMSCQRQERRINKLSRSFTNVWMTPCLRRWQMLLPQRKLGRFYEILSKELTR
ncbi:uncharacterized protein LOC107764390 isoform X1 [Nicotiana tabacum]|uniref:Uncharacterized protein LOC107764390 isoform X1 n=2 Tax=Nicotiana tabacum TaxID=4097 RepID=A0AC58T4L1_TOBAC